MEHIEDIINLNNKLDKIIELLTDISAKDIKANNHNEQEEPIKDNEEFNIIDALVKYGLPTDKEYIKDLTAIINKLDLQPNDIEEILKRLDKYQQDNSVKDIYKLSFKFMYNYKEDKDKDSYNSRAKGYRKPYRKNNSY